MIKFLKLIFSSSDNMNNIITLKEIESVKVVSKELIDEFLSIDKYFKIMEMDFNEKLETLIEQKKKTLIDIYPNYFKKDEKEKQEMKSDKYIPLESNRILEYPLLKIILPDIVFNGFLKLYIEHSYPINERIMKMYEKFKSVEKTLKKSIDTGIIDLKNDIKDVTLKTINYQDFYYFLNKLEQKLNIKFKVSIPRIRSVLYGCNPDDLDSQPKQIQNYYDFILYYERTGGSSSNADLTKFIENYSISKRNTLIQQEAFNGCVSKYIHNFKKDLRNLYDYHKTIPETLILSKTRFILYEKLFDKYENSEENPSFFEEEDKKLFSGYDVEMQCGFFIALRGVIFKYLNYEHKNSNDYFLKFEEMRKLLLQKSLKQKVVLASN